MGKPIVMVIFVLFSSYQNSCYREGPPKNSSVVIENTFLDNEKWRIVEMATAHGMFTIEIEILNVADSKKIAQELVGPLDDQYSEVLIYFYEMGNDENLPALRVQWTRKAGFSELHYQ